MSESLCERIDARGYSRVVAVGDRLGVLAHALNRPGVYELMDAAGNIRYIGSTVNLSKRLTTHFRYARADTATATPGMGLHGVICAGVRYCKTRGRAIDLEDKRIHEVHPSLNTTCVLCRAPETQSPAA